MTAGAPATDVLGTADPVSCASASRARMGEDCGVHANPAVMRLSREYDEVRCAARGVRQALDVGDPAVAAHAVRHLLDLLEPHTRVDDVMPAPPDS